MRILITLTVLLLAGCYSTGGIDGSAPGDGRVDPGYDHDWYDPGYDPPSDLVDTGLDMYDPPFDTGEEGPADGWDIPETWDRYTDPGFGCDPPLVVTAELLVDDGGTDPVNVELRCTVSFIDMMIPPDRAWIFLECGGTEHIVEIGPYPPLWIDLRSGTEVMFRYVVTPNPEAPTTPDRWFTIKHMDGRLCLAGTEASGISPPGVDAYDWYYPVGVGLGDPGCFAGATDCYDLFRLELSFGTSDPVHHSARIWDHGQGWVGIGDAYLIRVEDAVERRYLRCPGLPDHWYRFLLVKDR